MVSLRSNTKVTKFISSHHEWLYFKNYQERPLAKTEMIRTVTPYENSCLCTFLRSVSFSDQKKSILLCTRHLSDLTFLLFQCNSADPDEHMQMLQLQIVWKLHDFLASFPKNNCHSQNPEINVSLQGHCVLISSHLKLLEFV